MRSLVRILDALHWGASFMVLRCAAFLARRGRQVAPQTIVVLRNCFFGDYVVAVPALRALREAFPQARIVLLTATSFIPGWRDVPQDDAVFQIEPGLIDEVVRYTGEDLRSAASRSELRDRLAIRGPVISLALVYAADSFVSRCKRIGLCRLLGLPWPHGLTGAHTLPAQKLLNRYRIGRDNIVHQKDAALGSVAELLVTRGREHVAKPTHSPPQLTVARDGALVIGVAPFSKQPVKQWPLENFAALMVSLHEQYGACFEIYGASSDASAAAELTAKLPRGLEAIPMCGTLTPFELRERIRRVALVVALDSGPMHVASLVDTPVVAIFSQITLHRFWQPWGRMSAIVAHPVTCAACNTLSGECPLGTRACIEGIELEQVLDSVRRLLTTDRSPIQPSPPPGAGTRIDIRSERAQEQPQ